MGAAAAGGAGGGVGVRSVRIETLQNIRAFLTPPSDLQNCAQNSPRSPTAFSRQPSPTSSIPEAKPTLTSVIPIAGRLRRPSVIDAAAMRRNRERAATAQIDDWCSASSGSEEEESSPAHSPVEFRTCLDIAKM